MTLKVGLSGGIGSGKSTVSAMLGALGAAVVDADLLAREVVAPGSPGLAAVAARFGQELLDEHGALRRQALGRIVFSDPEALDDLNGLLHPAIVAEIQARIAIAQAAGQDVVVIDAALLVEFGLHRDCDLVVVVRCDAQTRVARVMARDGLAEALVQARIDAQASDAARLQHADLIIDNNGDLVELEQHVAHVWARIGSQDAGN